MAGPVFDAAKPEVFQQWIERGLDRVSERALVSTAARLVSFIVTDVIPKLNPQPVDKGIFRAGWRSKAISGGSEIFNTVPWAPTIEWGVRPENVKIGRAMITALEAWVKRKGMANKEDARGVAFAIANAMKKKGIFNRDGKKGLHVIEHATKMFPTYVREEYAREIEREFRGGQT